MKPRLTFFAFLAVAHLILLARGSDAQSSAQNAQDAAVSTQSFRMGWDAFMRDPKQTPLRPEELAQFRGISWFPIQNSYRVTARFARTSSAKTFFMQTSSGKPKVYVKFGILTFTLNHRACHLAAYQSQSLVKTNPDESVFVPFTDKTSGSQSYGGGRYLDFPDPKSNTVILDFNRAYNPYCAYTEGYSCPIPPAENRLPVAVLAGAKMYRH